MPKRIIELDNTGGVAGTDYLATSKGSEDVKATLTEVSNFILNNLSDATVLSKLLNVDSNTSGLNANFLQGFAASHFLNAANMTGGPIPTSVLPAGTFTSSFTPGGVYTNAGTVKNVIKVPEWLLGGRIMIQFGWTEFIYANSQSRLIYPEPFASGFSGEDKPFLSVTPECRRDAWSEVSTGSQPKFNVELDIRVSKNRLNSFDVDSIRTYGSNTDRVRAMYWAVGRY